MCVQRHNYKPDPAFIIPDIFSKLRAPVSALV
jgi:hypothetical protein